MCIAYLFKKDYRGVTHCGKQQRQYLPHKSLCLKKVFADK